MNNYRKELKKRKKLFSRAYGDLKKIMTNDPGFTLEEDEIYIHQLINYYEDLKSRGLLVIIEHNRYDIFSEIVDRAISNRKPFTDGKEEFKDTVIWLTYAYFAEESKLDNCFFISENTNEFFDESKTELHQDLLEDTKRIKGYVSIEKYMMDQAELLEELRQDQTEEENFQKLVSIDANRDLKHAYEYIEELVIEHFSDDINDEINYYLKSLEEIYREQLFPKYTEIQSRPFYSLSMHDIEREVYREEIVIYAVADISHDVTIYLVNQENPVLIGNKGLEHRVDFTFTINPDEIPSNFEVSRIITKELEPDEF
ncbi:PIN domain-containing protein [Paenibacillus sp. p3-SID867]|nr:PIN domain-containing protein [Paenibacillus sp. p3-SID867]